MANIEVIDPEGDVILVCGKTEIQVSSVRIFGVYVPLLNQILNLETRLGSFHSLDVFQGSSYLLE